MQPDGGKLHLIGMKKVFILLLFISSNLFPQIGGCLSPTINYSFACGDDSTQLNASVGFDTYLWTPSSGLSSSTISNPIAALTGTTSYTLTTTSIGSNLITNGDFSLGNTGFTSGQNYTSSYSPCNYYVGSAFFNIPGYGIMDHTASVDNMFMSIDGCTSSTILWEQTIPVIQPFTTYKFAFWASRADQVQPIFETHIIGNITGDNIEATQVDIPYTGVFTWDEYGVASWNSGANTSITIQVINLETNGFGNDFSMDDFSLEAYCITSASVTIDQSACSDSLLVNEPPEITTYIPNAFTPNNNGLNDVFAPQMYGVIEFKMFIFDRWGNEIFKTEDMNEGWNGRVNGVGEIVQQDVYVYKIFTKDLLHNNHSYIGKITVVK